MLSSAPGSTVNVTFFFFRSNKVLFSTFLRMGKSRSNFRCLPRLENQDCPQRGDLTRGLSAPSPTPHWHSVSCPRTLGTGPEAGHRPQQCPQHTGKVLPPRCSEPPPFLPFQVGSQMDHLNPGTHGGLSCCSGGRGGVSKQRRLPRGPEPRNEPGKQGMAQVLLLLSCSTLWVPRGDCVCPAMQNLSRERHLPQRSRLPASWAYARPRVSHK